MELKCEIPSKPGINLILIKIKLYLSTDNFYAVFIKYRILKMAITSH